MREDLIMALAEDITMVMILSIVIGLIAGWYFTYLYYHSHDPEVTDLVKRLPPSQLPAPPPPRIREVDPKDYVYMRKCIKSSEDGYLEAGRQYKYKYVGQFIKLIENGIMLTPEQFDEYFEEPILEIPPEKRDEILRLFYKRQGRDFDKEMSDFGKEIARETNIRDWREKCCAQCKYQFIEYKGEKRQCHFSTCTDEEVLAFNYRNGCQGILEYLNTGVFPERARKTKD